MSFALCIANAADVRQFAFSIADVAAGVGRLALSIAAAVSSGWSSCICYCLISQSRFP